MSLAVATYNFAAYKLPMKCNIAGVLNRPSKPVDVDHAPQSSAAMSMHPQCLADSIFCVTICIMGADQIPLTSSFFMPSGGAPKFLGGGFSE